MVKSTYYKEQTEAFSVIKKMALNGFDIPTIELTMLEKYGRGLRFVLNYLEKLELAGWIKVNGDKIEPLQNNDKEIEGEANEVLRKSTDED